MSPFQTAFARTRNAMIQALLDAGADPLTTGALLAHDERLSFALERIESRLARLERLITRRETRQSSQNQRKSTSDNVLEFPQLMP